MMALISTYRAVAHQLNRADWLLPTLARLVFAGTLLFYFWVSALTKIGPGLGGVFSPSTGAYVQIFPRAMENSGYDTDALSGLQGFIVILGTWAEFVFPALIVIGLLTRISALAMVGFIIAQSLTDLFGHGLLADSKALGAWFDRFPDAAILDQRAFWIFLLLVLVIKGAGPVSFDRALHKGT